MLPVQPGCLHRTQKELRPVRVLPRVRHGERSGCPMPERKVFVLEPIAVDRFATRAVVPGEVASLAHEIWYDPVQATAFEMHYVTGLSHPFLAGTQASEILDRSWHDIRTEFHFDPALGRTTDRNIEEDDRVLA